METSVFSSSLALYSLLLFYPVAFDIQRRVRVRYLCFFFFSIIPGGVVSIFIGALRNCTLCFCPPQSRVNLCGFDEGGNRIPFPLWNWLDKVSCSFFFSREKYLISYLDWYFRFLFLLILKNICYGSREETEYKFSFTGVL